MSGEEKRAEYSVLHSTACARWLHSTDHVMWPVVSRAERDQEPATGHQAAVAEIIPTKILQQLLLKDTEPQTHWN